MSFGGPEWLIVLLIVLVLFGGAKIPQLMKGVGEGMRELRKAQNDDEPTRTQTVRTEARPETPRDDFRTPMV